jgi:hypothetical protein
MGDAIGLEGDSADSPKLGDGAGEGASDASGELVGVSYTVRDPTDGGGVGGIETGNLLLNGCGVPR